VKHNRQTHPVLLTGFILQYKIQSMEENKTNINVEYGSGDYFEKRLEAQKKMTDFAIKRAIQITLGAFGFIFLLIFIMVKLL
jgi:hypothetical protein